jgi:phosphatidate cytidylyltransferase
MSDERDSDSKPVKQPRAAGEGVRIIGAEEAAALEARQAGRLPDDAPRFGDVPPQPSGPRPPHRFPLPEDAEPRPAGSPATPDLPHWTEPPTGEVPRILDTDDDSGEADLEAWSGLASRAPRWRDQQTDWEDPDFEDASMLADEETRVGALDQSRGDRSDLYSFDEPEPEPEPEPPRPRTTRIRTRPPDTPDAPPADGPAAGGGGAEERDIRQAVITGVAFAALALFCFWRGPGWAAALATVVVVVAASEVYDVFRRAGYRPATLLGLVATASLMLGAFAKGERAVPLVLALTVVFGMLWYLSGVVTARPTINLGVTFLGFVWVGVLGSFASLMLRYRNDEGIAFLLGAVIATVANDVGALFAGRRMGRTPLASSISPNKTLEGVLGAAVLTALVSMVLVSRISPWDVGSSLALALVVSIVAPLGDLCESMVKRDIGVKDMGGLLPGHGGILDRFDALLFVLPAVYYLVELLDLAGR